MTESRIDAILPAVTVETDVPPELRARIVDDPWARSVGVEFLELRRGYCRAALRLAPHMVNFQGRPHGAVIFALADVAFGAACNSHGPDAVALSMTISFLSTAAPGVRLVAEARAQKQGRRAGFYDIVVTDGEGGGVVATVHCIAHRVGGDERYPTRPHGDSEAPSPTR